MHVCPYLWPTDSSKFQPSTLVNDVENVWMETGHLWKTFTVMIVEFSKECFRIIGLEETASSCQSILEPSFNNQVTWRRKNSKFAKFCTFVGLLGPPDNSKKKRSSKFAKFCTFSWLVVSTWSEFDSKLKSYFAGDDDIRLGHDLHHVSHYNHQVIWDYVFHLIRIFSIGPFQYHQPHFMYINSIRSINLWTEPQSMYFIQNLYWLGRYHPLTETD